MLKGLDSNDSQDGNEFDVGNIISARSRKVTMPGAVKANNNQQARDDELFYSKTPDAGAISVIANQSLSARRQTTKTKRTRHQGLIY